MSEEIVNNDKTEEQPEKSSEKTEVKAAENTESTEEAPKVETAAAAAGSSEVKEEKTAAATTTATSSSATASSGGREGGQRGGYDRNRGGGGQRGGQQREYSPRVPKFRKKVCRFCYEKELAINYKKPETLERFITDRGKILPRRVTGTCAKHQRTLAREIKRARIIALLPFIEK